MKYKLLLGLVITTSFLASNSMAVTMVSDNATDPSETAVVSTIFGISGTVDNYIPAKSLIIINGIQYALTYTGDLSKEDLSQGRKVLFNVDKSSTEKTGQITKIWLQKEK